MNKTLGNYQIMIASKYFERIDDFINVEMAVKRFRGNIERFHFNPIPLEKRTRKYFTNLETLHLYDVNDKVFKRKKIFKHCIWYEVDYQTYLKEEEKGNDCKLVCYSDEDRKKYGYEIPNNVKILGRNCFIGCHEMKSITIPNSVTKIGYMCFRRCPWLENIVMPTTIRVLEDYCFGECKSLKSISISGSIMKISGNCFFRCFSLTSISVTNCEYFVYGNNFFKINNNT